MPTLATIVAVRAECEARWILACNKPWQERDQDERPDGLGIEALWEVDEDMKVCAKTIHLWLRL